jgi:hypothetical protein
MPIQLTGSLNLSGSLTTTGTITAQTLVVQTITSSVDFVTGSTRFGSSLSNTHVFSGSVTMNPGGLFVSSSGNVGIGTTPNTTAGITELAIGSSNTNPLISGIRDGVSAFSLSSDSGGTKLFERRNSDLILGTNNTARLTIASTGAATFSSSVTASASSLFNANNGALSADILTIRGGGGSGAFGFKVEANNGEDIFYTDHFTYNIIANPLGGKFGIGVTNPSGSLSIKAETSNTPTLVFQPATSVAPSAISNFLGANQTFTVIGSNAYVNNVGGITRFNTSYAGCFIAFDEGEIGFSSGTNGANPSQRIRILSGGDVNINGGNVRALGGSYIIRDSANTTTGGLFGPRRNWLGSGTDISPTIAAETGYGIYTYTNGVVSPTGPYVAPGGTTWTNGSSDVRKKKNFETTQGLAEILQIEPIKYHFNEDDDSSKKRLGFKAQNILPLIPEMVLETGELAEDESPYLTITPDYILPVLVKAIQELKADFDAYKTTHP